MADKVYEIDPNPDTVIILTNPTIDFAPWEKIEKIEKIPAAPLGASKKKGKKSKKTQRREVEPEPEPNRSVTIPSVNDASEEQAEESLFGGDQFCSKGESSTATTEQQDHDVGGSQSVNPPDEQPKEEEGGIRYHVSSRHLMTASPWFHRALTREGWSESGRDDSDGRFHITAEDWDEEALLILLNIFHLRNRQVPRTVTLEMLAKIAVLVDYYECGEAIELFTDMWIEHLKTRVAIPSTYCRDLILWMWVSWVFDLTDQFKQATLVAIKQSAESIRTMGLPIPPKIAGEIDLKRYQAMEGMICEVHSLLDTYRSASYRCEVDTAYSFQCGSILLGALTKGLDEVGLLSPRPEVPFTGLSFEGIYRIIIAIKMPQWYHNRSDYYSPQHRCNLNTTVRFIADKFATNIEGMSLEVFKGT